ncbi:putative inactive cadmium/zinc-transporting ATPase HMA3 [Panicum miliaceum]|uniref:Inactive cadmium/zinc-transporting ATPase HMA3 n=1 Tax=Panicum miliaceum TaxID=4540 RepID=A0A3L6QP19_PANMI|nr:putative inactive cadmium/zinc-transporting ATPase HMA3 [Panicum miliaceum]
MPGPAVEAAAARGGGDHDGGRRKAAAWEKTYLDVALVERLLSPIDGVRAVTVVVPSRTVIVEHDAAAVSQLHIGNQIILPVSSSGILPQMDGSQFSLALSGSVKVLNKAGLEASIRAYGSGGGGGARRWPSPFIVACGALLAASFFAPLLPALRWLALAAACVGSQPMLLRAFAAAGNLTMDINILMLIAVAGAVALGNYTEAGAIVFLFTVAEWLETLACTKASAGMLSLMSAVPKHVVLSETGQVVGMRDVGVGTVVAVKAGEVVPVDGVLVGGQSEVDESSLTGESFPVPKQPQSEVWASTMNLDGYIAVRTTALAENSTVAKMERLVEEAQNSRSKTQRLIDSCAKYYTPAVVVVAAGVVLVPLLLGAHDLKQWFQLSLVLLVSACPCALVLSTPVATFCALLRAARMGLLIKGGNILESLGEVRIAAFDKTGTITRGEFSISTFHVVGNKVEMDQLLYWVSSMEGKSSHPMAAALVEYSQTKSIRPEPKNVTEFHIYHGEGIYGVINGKHIYIGNKKIMARSSCQEPSRVPELMTSDMMKFDRIQAVQEMDDHKGVSIGHVICDGDLVGLFSLSDDCRTGAAKAIKELRSMGIKSVMITGDRAAAAKHAQEQLGGVLEELHSELLPEDKVRLIAKLKATAGATMMVGDGINDSPALAMVDVGHSMGLSGSAARVETSHATLMSSDILRVPRAVRLGRCTRRTIAGNVAFSTGAKAAVLVLAVAWRPVLWVAVLADAGTCLLVVLHSMLLLRDAAAARRACCGGAPSKAHACCGASKSMACCSTARSCQLAGAPHAKGPGDNDCHCCQKQCKPPEHSVVITIPAQAVA